MFEDLRDAYCHKVTVTNSQNSPADEENSSRCTRNYGFEVTKLRLAKIGPYRSRKFGGLEIILYLCSAFGECIASVGSSAIRGNRTKEKKSPAREALGSQLKGFYHFFHDFGEVFHF